MKRPNRQRFAICFAGRGQALVETALMFPVQLLMLSGLAEFGFALNYYKDIGVDVIVGDWKKEKFFNNSRFTVA
jgi:hypothetical protein